MRSYEPWLSSVYKKLVIGGETAFIDPRYRNRSLAESKLVEIIEKCWEYDPSKRPTVFSVVDFLKEALRKAKEE